MKLYTEEQVREAFDNGYKYASTLRPTSIGEHYKYVENSINSLTPIELPSYEEIEERAEFLFPTVNIMGGPTYIAHKSFIEGVKWMRDKLTNTKEK